MLEWEVCVGVELRQKVSWFFNVLWLLQAFKNVDCAVLFLMFHLSLQPPITLKYHCLLLDGMVELP